MRVPQGLSRINLPVVYPKYEVEFFETVQKCAEYIDNIPRVEDKIFYSNELSKIFIVRHHNAAMKLLRELINNSYIKGGDYRGQESKS